MYSWGLASNYVLVNGSEENDKYTPYEVPPIIMKVLPKIINNEIVKGISAGAQHLVYLATPNRTLEMKLDEGLFSKYHSIITKERHSEERKDNRQAALILNFDVRVMPEAAAPTIIIYMSLRNNFRIRSRDSSYGTSKGASLHQEQDNWFDELRKKKLRCRKTLDDSYGNISLQQMQLRSAIRGASV